MLKKLTSINKYLYLIFALALFVRLIGITHGFPFIFHPDEPSVVRSALGIMYDTNPGHFDWPHLHFYLNYFIFIVFIKLRGVVQILNMRDVFESTFPLLWQDPLVFYYLSRVFDALLGALTIIPVYLTTKYLFGEKQGRYAALIFAIIPFHVWVSRYNLIDVPATFWIAWAIYFCSKILYDRNFHYYLLAGLFIGFAASTKYNGGLIALMLPLAHLLRVWHKEDEELIDREGILMVVYAGLFSVLGFLIGTPYALFDMGTFLISDSPNGALWQFANVGKVDFVTQVEQFLTGMTTSLAKNFGYTFMFAYIGSVLIIIDILIKAVTEGKKKRITHDVLKLNLLLIPSLFMFFYISGFSKNRAHYFLIAYPFVAIIGGYVINYIVDYLHKKKKWLKYVLPVQVVFFAIPLAFVITEMVTVYRTDTRQMMYTWLKDNVTSEDTLYYDDRDHTVVLEKFSDNKVSRYNKEQENELKTGYMIINVDNPEAELDFAPFYNKVFHVYPTLRRGPELVIYKL